MRSTFCTFEGASLLQCFKPPRTALVLHSFKYRNAPDCAGTYGLFIMMARLNNLWQNVSFCLVIQASMLPATLAAKCYFTDGTEATNEMQPCFPEKANSACCSINKSGNQTNDICTSTGLCLAQVSPYTGFFILDACTDESWGSDCPQLNKTLCPIGMNFCNIWTLESIPPI
jgi:hypothetical protein